MLMELGVQARVPALRDVVDPSARIICVASGFVSAAGPVFGRVGVMLFTDPATNQIWKYTVPRWKFGPAEGELSVFRENLMGAVGLTLDRQGRLLCCEAGSGRVSHQEIDGSSSILAEGGTPKGMCSPNDLVYSVDGSIYFTDLPLEGSGPPKGEPREGGVYQITPLGETRQVSREGRRPGGIALGAKQLDLYVSDGAENNIRVHTIQADGRLLPGRVFAAFGTGAPGYPGGLKTDEAGNVYAAGPGGLWIFNRDGIHLGTAVLPELPSNCCWGRSFSGLYVTARTSVYFLPTKIRGTATF